MEEERSVARLFAEEPLSWGLRGDPYLWRAMATHLAHTPWPATAQQLEALIVQAFEQLTGRAWSSAGHFFVEAFAHGGMSSGGISMGFWHERGLPLLCARWARA
ncbi:hypothetical protein SAMN03159355_05868 [Pseudomonas sp. NFPP10]|uniref:hypothetical protein n=1 Tax=unclassified Pseudomonas TaxID=196821 RepID=UPI00088BE001|nr:MULTISPECIES: hypothetical protein [unclassified Pseudomonas]SDA34113.1 hypothetical protein SAMN03159465_05871 [Pseudomonas sp. NFPP12]SEM75972.1 hypothetical protein SAMN03159355_05868 [Pseudomonas sp. NFPP10]SFK36052.1 hypothetical protein SAMN03159416_05862 [Pseudomonas sp. NFPP08]SFN71189.1 hypothetical protein SAMN03159476_06118 [Pseudomonas sp. NFPP05]SFY08327.1 hypothetical protein SAMN03159479_05869 [Pseudomonas sp. NFPP09]